MKSRRDLLRALGASGAVLPFLPLTEREAAAALPRRLVVWFTPNGGGYRPEWEPNGTETDFRFGAVLAPVERHKGQINIIRGLDWKSWFAQTPQPENGHQESLGHCLTSMPVGLDDWLATGPSVDQVIAQRIGAGTPYSSLLFGVQTDGSNDSNRISYKAAKVPVPFEGDPGKVFSRLFGSLQPPGAAGPDPRALSRRSVVDLIKGELSALRPRLGLDDQHKMDAHLDAIRSFENRLAATSSSRPDLGVDCRKPDLANHREADALTSLGRQQIDNLVMSLACDLTRVAVIMWTEANSLQRYPFLGFDDAHHDLAHYDGAGSETEQNAKLTKIGGYFGEQFAYLLDGMKSIREGNGTMLDNTLVLWCNEHGRGDPGGHDRANVGFLLASGANIPVRGGRFLSYPGRAHADLFVSLFHALGLTDVTTYGNPSVCAGPLPGLLS